MEIKRDDRSVTISQHDMIMKLKSTTPVELNFQADINSDWVGDKIERRSVSGPVVYCSIPISWFSRKQQTVTLSSAEAEYITAAATVSELINIQVIASNLNHLGLQEISTYTLRAIRVP